MVWVWVHEWSELTGIGGFSVGEEVSWTVTSAAGLPEPDLLPVEFHGVSIVREDADAFALDEVEGHEEIVGTIAEIVRIDALVWVDDEESRRLTPGTAQGVRVSDSRTGRTEWEAGQFGTLGHLVRLVMGEG